MDSPLPAAHPGNGGRPLVDLPDMVDSLRRTLLAWFDARARDLPWRRTDDPYAIWVSEVMLQQTRVDTAVPYFRRWMERYPTVAALADAELDDVLKSWEGLGYYRRARMLHRAAALVRDRHGGTLPDHPDALRELPGVGEYTAGAVASIAFGAVIPAVDGNVRRVLARLLDLPRPTPGELRAAAGTLVDPARPGDFNQAVMELGATVCTPRSPRCGECPWAEPCLARRHGEQQRRPLPGERRAVPEVEVGVAVLALLPGRGPRLFLVRRPEEGLLAGMWEFPGADIEPGEAPVAAAERAASRSGGRPSASPMRLDSVRHAFSHLRATYHPFLHRVEQGSALGRPRDGWFTLGEVETLALPTAQRRILDAARGALAGP